MARRHTLQIKGIGNNGFRTVTLQIGEDGDISCRIGCFRGSAKWGLRRIASKYGKRSSYYKMCELAVKELKRQHKSPRFGGARDGVHIDLYHDRLEALQ